jgi:hypothetical protein
LRPAGGDVGQILYVHLELSKRLVSGFHGTQIALALVATGPSSGQAVLTQDPLDGTDAARKIELAFESLGSEARSAASLSQDLLLDLGFGFVRAGLGRTGAFQQAGATGLLLEAPPPLGHSIARAAKLAGRCPLAVLLGVQDQLQAPVKTMVLGTDHGVVWQWTHRHLLG